MSGHSKWSTIKRKKGVTDAVRGKLFTKLANLITIAAREGGENPKNNIALRLAIDKARSHDVPQANIERAIKRGTGETAAAELDSFQYEAVGPGSLALIINGITDNKNRTLSELRSLLGKRQTKIVKSGSQSWQFWRVGYFEIPITNDNQETIELNAIEAGAEDIKVGRQQVVVLTRPDKVANVRAVLAKKYKVGPVHTQLKAKNMLKLKDSEKKMAKQLIAELNDHQDIQSVITNLA